MPLTVDRAQLKEEATPVKVKQERVPVQGSISKIKQDADKVTAPGILPLLQKIDLFKNTSAYTKMKTKLQDIKKTIDLTTDDNIDVQSISRSENERMVREKLMNWKNY